MIERLLDSSAFLAWLRDEPGGETVAADLHRAAISAVNLAEVVAKMVDLGYSHDDAVELVRDFPCPVIAFDAETALAAGAMRAATRRHGLSLGDRACLALARREGCVVLTTDQVWSRLDVGVEIHMLR